MGGRKKREIPVGTRFERLTTTGITFTAVKYRGVRQSFVDVRCDCGNTSTVPTAWLYGGVSKSCGCLRREMLVRYGQPRLSSEERRKRANDYSRKYRQEHPEVAEIMRVQHRQWMKDHPEARHAYKARRRIQAREGMDKLDVSMSISYRQAIRHDPCFYCGASGEHDDHYFPLAKGGTDHWQNLVRACSSCNHRKRSHCGTWFMLHAQHSCRAC